MTKDREIEYVVRDYSAVDAQVDEIAKREKQKTRQLQIRNITKLVFLGLYITAGLISLILACAIAFRIAFPPKIEVIEKTEIVEKVVEPQPIIIQTPAGTSTSLNNPVDTSSQIFGNDELSTNSVVSQNKEEQDDSVIGKRSVTTFTEIPSDIKNFGPVITGWKWGNIKSKKPDNEYCYINKYIGGVDLMRYDLASKEKSQITKSNINQISSSGLNVYQLEKLITKCRWFSN